MMGSLIGLVLLAAVYLIPTWIGLARGVSGVGALALVNALLGWTVLGWACCLYMACVAGDQPGAAAGPMGRTSATGPTREAAAMKAWVHVDDGLVRGAILADQPRGWVAEQLGEWVLEGIAPKLYDFGEEPIIVGAPLPIKRQQELALNQEVATSGAEEMLASMAAFEAATFVQASTPTTYSGLGASGCFGRPDHHGTSPSTSRSRHERRDGYWHHPRWH